MTQERNVDVDTWPNPRRDGFTLLELMVVVIIVGVIMATALPKVGRTMAQTRSQRAATVIASDVQRAFSLAAQRRVRMRISVDTVNKKFYIKNFARDTTYLTALYNSKSEIGLDRLSASDTTFIIYPSGLAGASFWIKAITAGTNIRKVTVSKAGQIRILQL